MAKKKRQGKIEKILSNASRRQGRSVNTFRAILGEEAYARWVARQKEQARRQQEYIDSLPPDARAQAEYAQWWNTTGRFQRG